MIQNRNDITSLLEGNQNIGTELGVAKGKYSKSLINSNKFSKIFGIDIYKDHHDTNEYLNAIKYLDLMSNYTLIRCYFSEAISLFDDNYFNFIYIDGYAHTGQEEGDTLNEWFPKLKNGGIFAGHDYHYKWPKTIQSVDNFVKNNNLNLNLTLEQEPFYPSWYIIK